MHAALVAPSDRFLLTSQFRQGVYDCQFGMIVGPGRSGENACPKLVTADNKLDHELHRASLLRLALFFVQRKPCEYCTSY